MTYLRSLFLNFLMVFFVNRIIPDVTISSYEGVSNVGGDLFFSIILGLLNSLIFPVFIIAGVQPTIVKMMILAVVFSYTSYALVGIFHWGILTMSFGGWFFASTLVALTAFLTNYFEAKHER